MAHHLRSHARTSGLKRPWQIDDDENSGNAAHNKCAHYVPIPRWPCDNKPHGPRWRTKASRLMGSQRNIAIGSIAR